MGSLFKPKTTTVQQPFETNPWTAQQPALQQGFDAAQGALTSALQQGTPSDLVADLTPEQQQFMSGIQGIGNQGGAAGQALLSAGQAGTGDLAQFRQNAGNIFNQATTDATGQIIAGAEQYADNPYLQGTIDSAIADVNRGFQQDQATINAGAVGSGNINSTRAGVLESRALDDAQDRAADISTTLRGAAYESGLDRATLENSRQITDGLNANNQVGAGYQQSLQQMLSGFGLSTDALGAGLDAASIGQAQAQNEINGQTQGRANDLSLIAQYMQAIGGNYGQSGYQSQTTQSASPFQQLIGAGSLAAGMWR